MLSIRLPSLTKSKIKDILFYDQKLEKAERRSSVAITLEDDVNISRGDMIVLENDLPQIDKAFTATISWLDQEPLQTGNKYVLQHGVHKVLAKVEAIAHKIHPDYSGVETGISTLQMNDIAEVSFKVNKPIFFDAFKKHRTNGSFILIDSNSNHTVGAGFIQ